MPTPTHCARCSSTSGPIRRIIRAVVLAALAALTACDQLSQRSEPAPPQSTPTPAPPAVKTPSPTVARPTVPAPAATVRTLDDYKRVLAQRVNEASAERIHRGQLQPLLRAVVVLQFSIDGAGNIRNLRTVRSPEREAEHIATASLRRIGQLPAPPASILRGGLAEVTETWLIQDDGRFQLRTLSEGQRGE